jgi:hypothetical protein
MSTVERDGFKICCRPESRLGDPFSEVTQRTTGPEKTDSVARCLPGFGTVKTVIASRAVTVHASTPRALSQELAARA